MTHEEAKEYAKTMTYMNAVYNLAQAKCIPYRRATLIKVYELLDILDKRKTENVDDWENEELRIERLDDRKKSGKIVFKCPNCNGIINVKYPFCPWCGTKKRIGGD